MSFFRYNKRIIQTNNPNIDINIGDYSSIYESPFLDDNIKDWAKRCEFLKKDYALLELNIKPGVIDELKRKNRTTRPIKQFYAIYCEKFFTIGH